MKTSVGLFFFFKQKTAYEIGTGDWSSDVCSSDLPDNDVSRDLDEKRIAWNLGDIIENRPALSRWHPDYEDAFEAFISQS